MGKAPKCNALTGCIRRGVKRDHSANRRALHLSIKEVGLRDLPQRTMLFSGVMAQITLHQLSLVAVLRYLPLNFARQYPTIAAASPIIDFLTKFLAAKHVIYCEQFLKLFELDQELYDIPLDVEAAFPSIRIPRQDVRIDSWTLQECYKNTAFTHAQLHEIYNEFELHEACVDGHLRVHTGHGNHAYCFHPEEIFLFMLTKCRTGWSNLDLSDHIFGGTATRWSFGYPAILTHLDRRYRRTLSHEKLEDYVDQFPAFHHALESYFRRSTLRHLPDGCAQVRDGLHHLPFTLIGFVDCTIDRISVPYSGPAGDFVGAPRRSEYAIAQESVNTRYKKIHGIKMETVLLPNGISTVYGPCSERVNDIGLMRNLSGLDQFLFHIQQGRDVMHCLLEDGIYNCNALR